MLYEVITARGQAAFHDMKAVRFKNILGFHLSQAQPVITSYSIHYTKLYEAQGLNVAVRDAVVAANHLVPALSGDASPAAVDAAARAVEAERGHEIRVTQRFQRLALV